MISYRVLWPNVDCYCKADRIVFQCTSRDVSVDEYANAYAYDTADAEASVARLLPAPNSYPFTP